MSGGVWEPRHENRSTKHRTALCHFFFVLNSVTLPPQHMEYFSRHLDMIQCEEHKPFRWHKMFSEGRTLVEDEQCSG